MSDFRNFDINGIFGNTETVLTPDLFRRFGVALGSMVKPQGKFIVSFDHRKSSPQLCSALAQGLRSAGASVVNLGALSVPMAYYAAIRIRADGCAVVASPYSSESLNGLQWLVGNAPPDLTQVELLREAADGRSFRPQESQDAPEIRTLDVSYDYVALLQDTWFDSPKMSANVVIDSKFGSWAGRARRYLQAVFPKLVFSAIRDQPNASLAAQCEKGFISQEIQPLSQAVDRVRADIGFMLGEDGARFAVVDGNGLPLTGDELNYFVIQSFGASLNNEIFLHDDYCSSVVVAAAVEYGAKPVTVPPGGTTFLREMVRHNALLGVESFGKHYFRATCGHSDALFSICWILDYLAHLGKTIAMVRKTIPNMLITPELNIPWEGSESEMGEFLDRFAQKWDRPNSAIQGVRVDFFDSWIYAGKSIRTDDPALLIRAESVRQNRLAEIIRHCCSAMDSLESDYGTKLWNQYTRAG